MFVGLGAGLFSVLDIDKSCKRIVKFCCVGVGLGCVSVCIPTRVEYGGRNSALCSGLPLFSFSLFLSVIYIFHTSHFGGFVWLSWVGLGLFFGVIEWSRVGLGESYFHYTASARVNALGCFSFMISFESLFFCGVLWIFMIGQVHPSPELSYLSFGDVSVLGDFEASFVCFGSHVDVCCGTMFFLCDCKLGMLGGNLIAIYLNLVILLGVSLLLQFGHRCSLLG